MQHLASNSPSPHHGFETDLDGTVIFVYDYFLTLPVEIDCFWCRKFNLGRLLYLMARYGCILSLLMPIFIGPNTPQV